MNISYSRVQCYLRCPFQHYMSYIEGWKSKKPCRPLSFGSDFHKLLEHRGQGDIEKVFSEISEKYYELPSSWQSDLGEDYLDDLRVIFSDYQDVYKHAPIPTKTELEFNIPIGKYKGEPVIFKGFVDELYESEDGVKVGEHKTFTRVPATDFLVMNTQKNLYAKAVQILTGKYPKTIIWDWISSHPASEPVWLEKSQRFSAATSTKITPYSWARACKSHGITDNKVLTQGEQYQTNITNFFFRMELDYIPDAVELVWDSFMYTLKDVVKHGIENKSKNLTQDCSWCAYRDICHAQLTGSADIVPDILERDFEKVERS